MRRIVIVLFLLSLRAWGQVTVSNIDDITTQTSSAPPGWESCLVGACGGGTPGGTGTPTVFTHTFADATHSLDGSALKMSFTDPANTNWLYTYKIIGGSSQNTFISTLTNFSSTVSFYPDSNAKTYVSEYEYDNGWFSPLSIGPNTPNGTNYMFATQCKTSTGVLQLWNGGTGGGWVNGTYSGGNIPCSITANAFNSETVSGHITLNDQSSCTSGGNLFPTDRYDQVCPPPLGLAGTCYVPTNTNTCAQPLKSGDSSLVFSQIQADSSGGSSGNNMNIWYDGMGMTYSPNTGAAFSPSSLPFGYQTIGQASTPLTSTLTNSGAATLALGTPSIIGTNAVDFSQTNTCGSSLASGASCVFTVTYTPSIFGSETASLGITAGSISVFLPLTGSGANLDLTFSGSGNFGSWPVGTTSSPPNVFTVTNNTAFVLNFFSIQTAGTPNDFFITAQTCTVGSPLPVGSSCTVTVVFKPSIVGAEIGGLQFVDDNNGDGNGQQQIVLSGTGLNASGGLLTFSPNPANAGHQTSGSQSGNRPINVSNVGSASVTFSSITFTGANSGDFVESDNCTTLASNANCIINVKFTPGATGNRTANVVVTSNGVGSPQTIPITGLGCTLCNTIFINNGGNNANSAVGQSNGSGGWVQYPFQKGATGNAASYTCNPDDLFWQSSLLETGPFTITSTCAGSAGHPVVFQTYPPIVNTLNGGLGMMTGFGAKVAGGLNSCPNPGGWCQPGTNYGNCISPVCTDNDYDFDQTARPYIDQMFYQIPGSQTNRLGRPAIGGINQNNNSSNSAVCYVAASLSAAKTAAQCPVYDTWHPTHTYSVSGIPGLGTVIIDSNNNLEWVTSQTLNATTCTTSTAPTFSTVSIYNGGPVVKDPGAGTCQYVMLWANSGNAVACVLNNSSPCLGTTNYLAENQVALLSSQVPSACFSSPSQIRTIGDEKWTMTTQWLKSCSPIAGNPPRTLALFTGPANANANSGFLPGHPYQMAGVKELYGCPSANQGSWYLDTTTSPHWTLHKATCGTENINQGFYWSAMPPWQPGVMTITGTHDLLFEDIIVGSGDNDMPAPPGRPQTEGQPYTAPSVIVSGSNNIQFSTVTDPAYIQWVNGHGVEVIGASDNFQAQSLIASDIGGYPLVLGQVNPSTPDCLAGPYANGLNANCGSTNMVTNPVVNQSKFDHCGTLDSSGEGNCLQVFSASNYQITNNSFTNGVCGEIGIGNPGQLLDQVIGDGLTTTLTVSNGSPNWSTSTPIPTNAVGLYVTVGGTPTTGGVNYKLATVAGGGLSGTFTSNYTGSATTPVFYIEMPAFFTSGTISGNYLRNRIVQGNQLAWCADFGVVHYASNNPWQSPLPQPDVTPPTNWPCITAACPDNQFAQVIHDNVLLDAGSNYADVQDHGGNLLYEDQGSKLIKAYNNVLARGGQDMQWVGPPQAASETVPIGLYLDTGNSIYAGPGSVQYGTGSSNGINRARLINIRSQATSSNVYSFHNNIMALDSSLEGTFQASPWLVQCKDYFGTGLPWSCTNQYVHDFNILWDFSQARMQFFNCTGSPCNSAANQVSTVGIPWGSLSGAGVEDVHSTIQNPGFINPTPGIDNFTPTNLPALLLSKFKGFPNMNAANAGAVLNTVPLPAAANFYPTQQRINPNTAYYNLNLAVAPQSNLTGGTLTGGIIK